MVGTPIVIMHIEADTEDCTCMLLARCGGIERIRADCPEHGVDLVRPEGRFHTHAQQVDRVNRGGHWIK